MAEPVLALPIGEVGLRDPRRRDAAVWCELRVRAREHLEPWEVLGPRARMLSWDQRQHPSAWMATVKAARMAKRKDAGRVWVLTVEGAFAGMVELNHISRGGPDSQAEVGYWVDPRLHRQGVGSAGVALACDRAFTELGLHRLEALVQHANVASTALLAGLGFVLEGVAREVLWVDGAYRDHEIHSLLATDAPIGVSAGWSAGRAHGERRQT